MEQITPFVRDVILGGNTLQFNLTLALFVIGMGMAVYVGWRGANFTAALSGLMSAVLAMLYGVLAMAFEPGGSDAVASEAGRAVSNFGAGVAVLPAALIILLPTVYIVRRVRSRTDDK